MYEDVFRAAFRKNLEDLKRARPVEVDAEKHWREADLSFLFWTVQKKMAEVLTSSGSLKKVLNCSRRLRKTSTVLTKLTELGLKREGAMFRYIAPTKMMLRKIVRPIMNLICQTAPTDLKPVWRSQDGLYFFPSTGTELHIYGANNGHEDDARGTAADVCVVDEAQLIRNLKYIVDDVLMPQLITTGGPLWMMMTPPKTPVHECRNYVIEAQAAGTYAEFDIHQSEYGPEKIHLFCTEAGGPESTTWKREYLCKFVVDTNYSIIPEWRDAYVGRYVPNDLSKFYYRYEGLDISGGSKHKTANLYAVYDFKEGKLFILGETLLGPKETTTRTLAESVKAKEAELWGQREIWGTPAPFGRVADNNNLILLQDMGREHGIHFAPTTKDTLDAMVNNLRLRIGAGSIVVDPSCEQLIGCLKYGVWDDKRKKWEESDIYGHFDALAALMYLVRYVDYATNPIPAGYGINEDEKFQVIRPTKADQDALELQKALGLGRKRR